MQVTIAVEPVFGKVQRKGVKEIIPVIRGYRSAVHHPNGKAMFKSPLCLTDGIARLMADAFVIAGGHTVAA